MKLLKETTKDFNCDYNVPLHTYMIEKSKVIGYIKEGTTDQIMFPKPMFFDQRKRTFVEIK